MLDKKELNSMELDMVAGGNIFEDFFDEVEDVVEDVWDGIKDVSSEVANATWKGMKAAYDAINHPIQE
ncbi:hypothetical protein [Selenomonas sp. AE3005]|uniref:hypothetical protein n=1 Tax=Selenomonas sp. AE3005 TaxID=1485543 RepID=UPI00048308AE|nr:hypothetical protein [Selenomonas sp. AE3005]